MSEKRQDCDPHGLGSKLTRAILLGLWEKRFTALSSTWRNKTLAAACITGDTFPMEKCITGDTRGSQRINKQF